MSRHVFLQATLVFALGAAVTAQQPAPAGPPRGPLRQITQIAPNLYRANNGNWYTIFMVTPAGILLGDPISLDFAKWLKGELMRALPSACGAFDGHSMAEWIKSYRTVEAIDFDRLATGHGGVVFAKTDVSEAREFFEDLWKEVRTGMVAGKNLKELQTTTTLDKYKAWAYSGRLCASNIAAAYTNLRLFRE